MTAPSLRSKTQFSFGYDVQHRPAWLVREGWTDRPTTRQVIWLWVRSRVISPDVEDVGVNQDLADAERWASLHSPTRDHPVYETIQAYAEKSFEQGVRLAVTIDRKADDLMKTSAAIGAALATAARIAGLPIFADKLWMLLASVGCRLIAALISARSRTSANKMTTITVRAALAVADSGEVTAAAIPTPGANERQAVEPRMVQTSRPSHLSQDQMRAMLSTSSHFATVGNQIMIGWKDVQLARATRFFCLALILLISTPAHVCLGPPRQ